jgi:hypothetical protein
MASKSGMYDFTSLVPKPVMLSTADPTYSQYYGTINARNNAVYGTAMAKAQLANQLSTDYQNQYNQAKTANEQRYNQILSGFGDLNNTINSSFASLSDQAKKDIAQQTLNAKAKNAQALVNSGMVGTTILPSLNMQADKNAAGSLNNINDQIAMQKLQALTANQTNQLGFMERREDTYPNAQLYSQLLQQFGNYSDISYAYK